MFSVLWRYPQELHLDTVVHSELLYLNGCTFQQLQDQQCTCTDSWMDIHTQAHTDTITYFFFVTQYIKWAEKALTNTFHLHHEGFFCTFSELIIFLVNDGSNLLFVLVVSLQ